MSTITSAFSGCRSAVRSASLAWSARRPERGGVLSNGASPCASAWLSLKDQRACRNGFTPATIDVFPSGISSSAVTVDLANGDYGKTISASTAGFIRVSH